MAVTMRFTNDNPVDYDSVTVPGTYTAIESEAFRDNFMLRNVTVEDGVREIGVGAFENCENLRNVNFPETPFVVRDRCFAECVSLEEIIMPQASNILECRRLNRAGSHDPRNGQKSGRGQRRDNKYNKLNRNAIITNIHQYKPAVIIFGVYL